MFGQFWVPVRLGVGDGLVQEPRVQLVEGFEPQPRGEKAFTNKPTWFSILAAILTLVAGLAILFSADAPYVAGANGVVPLNLEMLGRITAEFLRGTTCSPGLTKLIGLDCRLQYLARVFQAIAGSRAASIHAVALGAAVTASWATTAYMMYTTASKRERLVTLRGWRLHRARNSAGSART
jgi:hypothetical protein